MSNKISNFSYRYSSKTRIFSCLGQDFQNVAPYEVENMRLIAIKVHQKLMIESAKNTTSNNPKVDKKKKKDQ